VEAAIETGVERAVALGAFVAKADAILNRDFARTVEAVHINRLTGEPAMAP
jgi:hypothetical protein